MASVETNHTAKILVVDDDPDIRTLLRLVLMSSGFHVTLAEDGDQAIRRVAEDLPDLVLCDILMPNLDGYETLAALRSNPSSRGLPVLIISARGESQAVKRALDAGANGYFVKPFETRDLVAEIRRLLSVRAVIS
ncbi:MAG: response regulator [Anaerolineae bacterium]|nr:response regulator [Anaerolineae bacterium]